MPLCTHARNILVYVFISDLGIEAVIRERSVPRHFNISMLHQLRGLTLSMVILLTTKLKCIRFVYI